MLNTIYANNAQFNELLTAIQGGDTTAIATALNNIKNSIDNISGGSPVEIDNTQWNSLINAIQSQSITFNLSNLNTDNTLNNSLFNSTNLTTILNLIYNTLFNTDTNIVKWETITSFSQFDVYLFKIGIIKILWIDTAKTQINSGWQSGGVGNLPSGYEALLDPVISVNKTLRNATQMFITVNANGNLNINPSATITSGYVIRQSFIYI